MAQAAAIATPTDETAEAADIVERFLVASMVPDPQTAARYIAERPQNHLHGRPQVLVIRAKPRPSTPSATSG